MELDWQNKRNHVLIVAVVAGVRSLEGRIHTSEAGTTKPSWFHCY